MNGWDMFVLAVIAVVVAIGVAVDWKRKRKHGMCSGNCMNCGKSCQKKER